MIVGFSTFCFTLAALRHRRPLRPREHGIARTASPTHHLTWPGTRPSGRPGQLTLVDRFGVWLSEPKCPAGRRFARRRRHRRLRVWLRGHLRPLGAGQGGLGDARRRRRWPTTSSAHPKVTAVLGELPGDPGRGARTSLDVVLCLSVLEHLSEPDEALGHFHRVLRPGGVCVVNVPTWLGQAVPRVLRLPPRAQPPREMDDHKRYYDPRDLWPLLVQAGFLPHAIRCRRHKFGLNAIAVCRKEEMHHVTTFAEQFIAGAMRSCRRLPDDDIERCADGLAAVRERRGAAVHPRRRGVGRSRLPRRQRLPEAVRASRPTRPTDNVSELTARTNDEGWDTTFDAWLRGSRLDADDAVLVFSVGGGSVESQVSVNLVRALELATERRASIFGIVGRDGGLHRPGGRRVRRHPAALPRQVTPHTEGLCAVRVASPGLPSRTGRSPDQVGVLR